MMQAGCTSEKSATSPIATLCNNPTLAAFKWYWAFEESAEESAQLMTISVKGIPRVILGLLAPEGIFCSTDKYIDM
jgi:hypothetical protein